MLDSGGGHGRSIAELGIGTKPAAILTGNVLEDEKVIGTMHLAFGTSGVNVAGVQ
jgi:leucyl aminopeptidase (aminopeptidase T)